ncbi:histidine phosphatase family protein [archaeon]|nr:MAG: histidine phosphatase family protein [archaeon]
MRARVQADATAAYIARHFKDKIAAVYSSDLCRASETARRIAAALSLPTLTTPAFRETGLGVLEGLTEVEMREKHDATIEKWRSNHALPIPGGESAVQRYYRTILSITELCCLHPGEHIVVVTHGGVLDDFARMSKGLPFGRGTETRKLNAGINIIAHHFDASSLRTVTAEHVRAEAAALRAAHAATPAGTVAPSPHGAGVIAAAIKSALPFEGLDAAAASAHLAVHPRATGKYSFANTGVVDASIAAGGAAPAPAAGSGAAPEVIAEAEDSDDETDLVSSL